jgi:hypothetical protein
VYCNKKGLSFFSLLYKNNANNRRARTQATTKKKSRFVDTWAADKSEKGLRLGLIFLSFNIVLAFCVLLSHSLFVFIVFYLPFFISHCNANNGYFSKAIRVGLERREFHSP